VTILESLRIDIERSLDSLDPKCREIIKLNYGIGYSYPRSLDEIGEKYSLTRERVRQIKEKGLRKLRVESRSKILRSYL
jgi:RNA polymerase primary sigma factor